MFTGLIESIGEVCQLSEKGQGFELQIQANFASEVQLGESVAVNGCCLTATQMNAGTLSFDLLQETLNRTNLRHLQPGKRVNLERAVRADSRMGGHFVQGHVDTTATILNFEEKGADHRLKVELPDSFKHYVAFKGSIAINGISLTVAELLPDSFICWIIPHTCAETNLSQAASGDLVNLEFDILAKYVERIVSVRGPA